MNLLKEILNLINSIVQLIKSLLSKRKEEKYCGIGHRGRRRKRQRKGGTSGKSGI